LATTRLSRGEVVGESQRGLRYKFAGKKYSVDDSEYF
jgi:hypothetical protein